jgi:hypothetical protein
MENDRLGTLYARLIGERNHWKILVVGKDMDLGEEDLHGAYEVGRW